MRSTFYAYTCVYFLAHALAHILCYRIYKIPDGKPENTFAFSGEAKNKKYATEIIHECHEAWRRLITGETPEPPGVITYVYHVSNLTNVPHIFL